jgi:branched-chain amino acid transport system substrate-binding protein
MKSFAWKLSLLACIGVTAGTVFGSTGAVAQDDKPLVMGASISLTGAYARTAEEYLLGYEIWRDEVNARGGILGRKIEFKVYDDQSDPTTAAKLAERLITSDKVDFMLSPFSSPVVLAASTVTEKYGYPLVAGGGSAQAIWERGYKYIFQIYPQPRAQVTGILEVAKELGVKTIAAAAEDTVFSKELGDTFVKLAKEEGFDVVFYEQYGKGPSDLSPLLLKAKALNPDMLYGATYLPESVLLTRQAKELGFNAKLYAFSIGPALDDFVSTLGTDAEYIIGTTLWEPTLNLPGVEQFVAEYSKRSNARPPYHAAGAYAAGQVLEAAINQVGSFDNEKIRDALQTLSTETIFGPYGVDEKGAQTSKFAYIIQIQDGVRKIVWPTEVAEQEFRGPTPTWEAR